MLLFRSARLLAALVLLFLLGCGRQETEEPSFAEMLASSSVTAGVERAVVRHPASPSRLETARSGTRRGYAEMPPDAGAAGANPSPGARDDGASFTLNFVDVEAQEFVRVVFEEVLRENVVIDPAVSGRVTVRTAAPVSKSVALDLIRGVLAQNGAALRRENGVYRITAGQADGVALSAGPLRVIPLRNIDVEQARTALQAFGADSARLAGLDGGRVLVASGTDADLERWTQVLGSLDVDQMRGKAFVLQPLETAAAKSVAGELTRMFGANPKTFGALPIERMNAVLLMGTSTALVQRARRWAVQLDQGGGERQREVHVYPVQNRNAAEIAGVLQSMLAARGRAASGTAGVTAPSLTPASASVGAGSETAVAADDLDPTMQFQSEQVAAPAEGAAPSGGGGGIGSVAISADTATNSLVIVASDEDYALLEKAIRRLDVMPPQVLIEATIAEVTLNDSLKHGVRWFFESGNHGFMLSDASGTRPSPITPGFNYVFSVASARLVINALENMTSVQVISSPALTVLDNQTATLKVGDQVPIATRSARGVTDPDAPIVNEIELKDTGIILTVKPRVNASGLVQLDISQEISDVVETTTSTLDSPTIRQRAITSSVVVQSGTEIILGGLISSQRERSKAGLPLLKDIPVLGEAFTSAGGRGSGRTELLIIIKPVVLATSVDVQAVTSEIKARMLGSAVPR